MLQAHIDKARHQTEPIFLFAWIGRSPYQDKLVHDEADWQILWDQEHARTVVLPNEFLKVSGHGPI